MDSDTPLALKPFPEAAAYTSLGIRVDCLHDFSRRIGAAQGCFSLTGMRLDHREVFHSKLAASIRLDPLGSLNKRFANSPWIADKPLVKDSALLFVDTYQLLWTPRPHLEIALGTYSGATALVNASQLALAPHWDDAGWDQTAISVSYELPALGNSRVRFIGGNGEGEILGNEDPGQYFAFELHAHLMPGLLLHSGLSWDANHVASMPQRWEQERLTERCGQPGTWGSKGFGAKRMLVSLELDGNLEVARGLRFAGGWQRSELSDLNKDKASVPSATELDQCTSLDPDTLLVEDPEQKIVNTMEHTVSSLSGSYQILATYFIGAYYERHSLRSKVPFFEKCLSYDGYICREAVAASGQLGRSSYGFGGGLNLTEGLLLSLEYHISSYAQPYKRFYYQGRDGKAMQSRDMFNARIAYNWN